jgi:hypothetical protein
MNEHNEPGSHSSSKNDCNWNVTVDHFRVAGAEILKGIRSVLDLGIDYLSKNPAAKGTTVNVE